MQTSNGRKILNNLGYHACEHNVLYDMEYCDPGGVNLAVLPENLHAILLGLYIQQLQGFGRAKQLNNNDYYVFTEKYLEEIEINLKLVGYELLQQSDPDLPRTFFHLVIYLILGTVKMAVVEKRPDMR